MNCPKCGGDTCVRGSFADSESVQRRRVCKKCGHVFYTSEYEVDQQMDYIDTRKIYYNSDYRRVYQRQRRKARKGQT